LCYENISVIRKGKRRNLIRYFCKACLKSFSIDFSPKKINIKKLLSDHIKGLSIRQIQENNPSLKTTRIFELIAPLIKQIPSCIEVTKSFCDMSKFSGKLVFDGTYVSVKGYDRKIPMIWGFDYDSHDCPHVLFVPSENFVACKKYFSDLKKIKYNLRYLVCDDNEAIKQAARDVFPNVIIQTCLKHYLANIKFDLGINSFNKYSNSYLSFYRNIYQLIFSKRLCEIEISWEISKMLSLNKYSMISKEYFWLTNIMFRIKELTNYHMFENCPNTTNLIEGFNSHFKDRIDNIRGFKSFHSAKRWLNAYVVKRRLTKFKACGRKFKHLNGKTPLENTLKNNTKLPDIFG